MWPPFYLIYTENNRIFLFGIAASYKMPDPLHALIQGSSGSGKTHLLTKISSFIPKEDKKHFTRVTESSFYNYGMYDLEHKLICLEDLDGMKEDAYLAFRELQSRGMISSSTSGKDEEGQIRAFEKVVYGPIASMSCTTKGSIYEDNMNRCFLIAVDESKAQTQQIIRYQNSVSAGEIDKQKQTDITEFIRDCIRCLKSYEVVNPYANKVNLPEEAHKPRRLNDLYQSYVKQITLLNQYRRSKDHRKRENPLHLMCLGASGTGKTHLQEKVGELMPEEDKLEITTLSENAFYYFGKEELKHKLILIEDLDGAEAVLYPLRELQSKRRISKTVTLKDNKGNLKTVTLKVEGPVSVSGCTTREKLYEDNANRCLLIYIDSSAAQDKKIMAYQQAVSSGMVDRSAEQQAMQRLQNMQRLLQPVRIRNLYASMIQLPERVFKPRRTMLLLLSFIETITFYHQYQRQVSTDRHTGETFIETTPEDIAWAFRLLKEALFTKSDELTGACRSFFDRLKTYLKDPKASFYTREIRKAMRLNPSNLKRYMIELTRYGYVKISGGSKYKGYEYQVVDGQEYEALRSDIDQQLDDILQKIKQQ